MAVFNNILAGAAGSGGAAGYEISRSLRFNSADSAYLSRTPSSAGNLKTWTVSFWIKKVKNDSVANFYRIFGQENATHLYFYQDNLHFDISNSGTTIGRRWTSQVFRDNSAWFHVVAVCNTPASTASERMRLYINGSEVTAFGNTTDPLQNADTAMNTANQHTIGYRTSTQGGAGGALDAYIADFFFIDGQALAPSDFGEYDDNNVWQPKAYSGTYGTNGFHLDFSDNSSNAALGTDSSGNSNDWTVNNISVLDGTVATAGGALPILNTTDNHGGTVGSGTRTDSNSSSIVLALPLNGTNGGTTFTDQSATIKGSGSPKTITRNGDVDTVTSNSQFYGSSAEFDGNGDFLSFSHTGGLGSGDFTIEYWAYHDSLYDYITHFCNTRGASGFNVGTDASGDFLWYDSNGGGGRRIEVTGAISAGRWYHFAYVRSSGVLTGYLNGVSQGTYSTSEDYSDSSFNIGTLNSSSENFTGHMQDVRMYVGAAKYTSNFNPPSRTGGSGCDSLVDSPTNGTQTDTGAGGEVRGNYCTWNLLINNPSGTYPAPSNGNLDGRGDTGFTYALGNGGTFVMPGSGKWYFEVTVTAVGDQTWVGVAPSDSKFENEMQCIDGALTYRRDANKTEGAGGTSQTNSSYGDSYTTNDIIGVALDLTAGTLVFYKNGVSQGTAFSSVSGKFIPIAVGFNGTTFSANFGQRAFAYTAPSGFKALCTANLTDPTIADGSTAMDVALWTGTGSSQTVSLDFNPDLIWAKTRSNAVDHKLTDVVRGFTKILGSNNTAVEETQTTGITATSSTGFTIGTSTDYNTNSRTYVAWAWDGGTSTVSNTDGSITSSVRANQSAGFSIVTYTGVGSTGTVGHGLGAAPSFYIVKARTTTAANSWRVYHSTLGATKQLFLEDTLAQSTNSNAWNDTAPTSTVFSVGSLANESSGDYVAYCFAPVEGYSAFGSFETNGTADNVFVYLGFRARFFMYKRYDSTGSWVIVDTARNTYNLVDKYLQPNDAAAEVTFGLFDILSNGIKIRISNFANGSDYIYAAFAEHPFKTARAR